MDRRLWAMLPASTPNPIDARFCSENDKIYAFATQDDADKAFAIACTRWDAKNHGDLPEAS
jgi:hypothetical protein